MVLPCRAGDRALARLNEGRRREQMETPVPMTEDRRLRTDDAVAVATRIFLLSPAHAGGKRAAMLFRGDARFDLATRIRSPEGAPLGEVFSFVSGLYFRGKLA